MQCCPPILFEKFHHPKACRKRKRKERNTTLQLQVEKTHLSKFSFFVLSINLNVIRLKFFKQPRCSQSTQPLQTLSNERQKHSRTGRAKAKCPNSHPFKTFKLDLPQSQRAVLPLLYNAWTIFNV